MIARLPMIVAFVFIYTQFNILFAQKQNKQAFILDMVHNNPGEDLTVSDFNNSTYLKKNGYNGKVMNDFVFPHAAIKFKKINPNLFPDGTPESKWIDNAAKKIKQNIAEAHAAGIKIYYFSDIIVLPKKLVAMYKDEITDENGKISFERPKTVEIHRLMLQELFETFPDLDGLVIRTGETYTNNVPYHTGNNPITKAELSHIKLISLLREEVCVKLNKQVFYRTWSFGGMHDDKDYYLKVTNTIEPHDNLIFSVKHTKGDYHRTYDFNPTITLGKHQQIIEVQCQREYEGKGAYPNYVMDGVINGFEEYFNNKPQPGFKSLNDIKNAPNFCGVWSWSRGGGWVGPYISNELWPRLNAYVLSEWYNTKNITEQKAFSIAMYKLGVRATDTADFRKLSLLSAKAVLRGHASAKLSFDSNMVFWMRDEFLSGIEPEAELNAKAPSEGFLYARFSELYKKNQLELAIQEKYEAVQLWQQIVQLSNKIQLANKSDNEYLKVSAQYGLLLHEIIAEGWQIMALGFVGDSTGNYKVKHLENALRKYDDLWKQYTLLKQKNSSCATLYKPFAFVYQAPHYHLKKGMDYSVDKYRKILQLTKVKSKSKVLINN